MNYEIATNLRNDLLGMIGEFHEKRMISDVVIAPVDEHEFKRWAEDYLRNGNQGGAILPFVHSDLMVLFVYKYNGLGHERSGIFMYENVLLAAKTFGLDIDISKYT